MILINDEPTIAFCQRAMHHDLFIQATKRLKEDRRGPYVEYYCEDCYWMIAEGKTRFLRPEYFEYI